MTSAGVAAPGPAGIEQSHKLPSAWRYPNVSTLWIPYFGWVIKAFYHLRIRHEVATVLSIGCGLAAAWLIFRLPQGASPVAAAGLVHLKDVFDATDGAVARMTGTGHRFGRFLDTVGDGVVFTSWITATAAAMAETGTASGAAASWAIAGWLALFLQCSYFNFHHLHYVRLAGAHSTSKLDESDAPREADTRAARIMASVYRVWFGWQDRLIAALDRRQRSWAGLPGPATGTRCNPWFGARGFMVANSALCFGTHAFVLIVLLLTGRPEWFLPVVAVGMTVYWAGILLARQVRFARAGTRPGTG